MGVSNPYVVKAEKLSEFDSGLNEFLKCKETHQDLFKGLRSRKLLRQEYGAISGLYIEMWEFDSLADMETNMARIFSDEGMKRIGRAFHQLVEPHRSRPTSGIRLLRALVVCVGQLERAMKFEPVNFLCICAQDRIIDNRMLDS